MFEYTAFGELKTAVSINDIHGYTGYVQDKETALNYANARMYNPTIGRFISKDILRVDSLNRYLYVVNNPVNAVDLSGELSTDALNLISLFYMQNIITDSQAASIIFISNVLGSGLQMEGDFKNFIQDEWGIDVLNEDKYEDCVRNKNVTLQSIYLSFHEISQVIASKMIYQDVNFDRKFSNLMNFPQLEFNVNFWGRREADIVSGNYVWEVKPNHYSINQFNKSLNKYTIGKYVAGFLPSTRVHNKLIAKISKYGKITMNTTFRREGHIGYCFNVEIGDESAVTNAMIAKELEKDFQALKN